MAIISRALGRQVGGLSRLSRLGSLAGRKVTAVAPPVSARRSIRSSTPMLKKAWDTQADQYKFWNREDSISGQAQMVLDMSPDSIQKEARILCLSSDDDAANKPLHDNLPFGSRLLHVGSQSTDFPDELVDESPNVLFVSPSCPHARLILPLVLAKFPTIEWIHVRSAGIDFLESDELPYVGKKGIVMTNAKVRFYHDVIWCKEPLFSSLTMSSPNNSI